MEHAAGNAVQPPAQRRQPDAEKTGLHPGTEARQLPAERGRADAAGQLGTGHSMSDECGHAVWPEFILFRSDRASAAAVSTRIFHVGGVALACCLAQRSSASASAARSSNLGGGGGAISIRVLQAAGGKGLDQLNFRRGVSGHGVHAGQMPRAAKHQDNARPATTTKPGQKSCRSTSRKAGFTGGWGTRFIIKAKG